MKKEKFIRITELTQEQRTDLRIKTLAHLRINGLNVRRTSRESRVHESTIRAWLREDNDVARELSKDRQEKLDQQRHELRREATEKKEVLDLEQAKWIHDQSEQITTLAMDKVTMLANQLVESLMASLLTEKPKFYDRMMSFAILFDKIQIFQGNPTSISASLGRRLSRDERAERTKQLLETAEQRREKLKVVPANAQQKETATG